MYVLSLVLIEQIKTLKCVFLSEQGKGILPWLVLLLVTLTSLRRISLFLALAALFSEQWKDLQTGLQITYFSRHVCSHTVCSAGRAATLAKERDRGKVCCCHLHCLTLLCNIKCNSALLLW